MVSININTNRCKGCGICIAFCPKSVFVPNKKGMPVVEKKDQCTNCGLCVMRCPDFAIEMEV